MTNQELFNFFTSDKLIFTKVKFIKKFNVQI